MVKKILLIIMAMIMVFSTFLLVGCSKKASSFTEEEHIQRVTERIEKRYMTSDANHTSFIVYPLYNEHDELKYFLVEFEPYGFIYVLLRDEQLKAFSWLGASTSMYKLSNSDVNNEWSPFVRDETNSQPKPDIDKIWKLNENGEKLVYNISPYKVAKINNEKKYLLFTNSESLKRTYVPSMKRDEKFLNLISNEEFEIIEGNTKKAQAYAYITFNAKSQFDL